MMVQAAAKNGLDFEAADLRDHNWWRKAGWVLDRIEDDQYADLLKMQHAQHINVLDYSTEQKVFEHHWEAASEIIDKLISLRFPWTKDAGKKSKQKTYDSLMDAWKKKYGDIRDPKVKQHFAQIAENMRKHAEKHRSTPFSAQRKMQDNMERAVRDRQQKRKK